MIKKGFYLLLIITLISNYSANAQMRAKYGPKNDKPANNSAYIEFLGSGFQWSVNYERDLGKVLVRIGGSYATEDVLVPFVVSYQKQMPAGLALEFGAGMLNVFVVKKREYVPLEVRPDYEFFPTLNIGARYQPDPRGFFLKVAFTPIIDMPRGGESYFFGQEPPLLPVVFWGGVSFGISF